MKKTILILTLFIGFLSFAQVDTRTYIKNGKGILVAVLTADPECDREGQIYWNKTSKEFRRCDGTSWEVLGADGIGTDDQTATEVVVNPAINNNTNVQTVLQDHESRLDGLAAGGSDGVVSNAVLTDKSLNFTGSGGGFNGIIDFASFALLTDLFSGDYNDLTNKPTIQNSRTDEEITDLAGGMVSGNTEGLIDVTFDDVINKLNFTVENDLSLYDNSISNFSTGAHTVDTNTQLTKPDIEAFGFVEGAHTVNTDSQGLILNGNVLGIEGNPSTVTLPSGGGTGDVTKVGTPVNNQLGVWVSEFELEGEPDLVWFDKNLSIAGSQTLTKNRVGKFTLLNNMYVPDMVSGDYAEFILGRNESTANRGTIYYYYDGSGSDENALGFGFRGNTPTILTKFSGDAIIQRDLEVSRNLDVIGNVDAVGYRIPGLTDADIVLAGGGSTPLSGTKSTKPEIEAFGFVDGAHIPEYENTDNTNGRLRKYILPPNFDFQNIPINYDNGIWEIRNVHDLGGLNITLPENVTLKFNGGRLTNYGTITGNNTKIDAGLIQIFDTSGIIEGSFNVEKVCPQWFGALGDGLNDDTLAIQSAIDFLQTPTRTWQPSNRVEGGGIIFLSTGRYLVTNSLLYYGGITVEGSQKMGATISFVPTLLSDLFVSNDSKFTRALSNQEGTVIKNLTLIGDAVGGNLANIALNFEKVLSLQLDNVNIYNFDTGMIIGSNAYYGIANNTYWRGNRLNIKTVNPTGPLTINGGLMSANTVEWGFTTKRMDCFIENGVAGKIIINSMSAEIPADCPVNDGFILFRGALDGSATGAYFINGTYHESYFPLTEIDLRNQHKETRINPFNSFPFVAKLKGYNDANAEIAQFGTERQYHQKIERFGSGTLTEIIQNTKLKNGKYLKGVLNNDSYLDNSSQFFSGIPTIRQDFTSDIPNLFFYYWDVPSELYSQYEGNFLVFTTITKASAGAELQNIQIYIDGTNQVIKSADIKSIDYGNGYVMHAASAYIPYNNDSTKMRLGIKISAVNGSSFNLAYMSVCVNGDDKYIPMTNNDDYKDIAPPSKGVFEVGDYVKNSNTIALGSEPDTYVIAGWVCTESGSPGIWKEHIIEKTIDGLSFLEFSRKPKIDQVRWNKKTTAQRDAIPIEIGVVQQIYNTDNERFEFHNGNEWVELPDGNMIFKGDWNAFSNTPILSDDDTMSKGDVYVVSESGTQNIGTNLGTDITDTATITNNNGSNLTLRSGGFDAVSLGNSINLRPIAYFNSVEVGAEYEVTIRPSINSGVLPNFSFNNGSIYIFDNIQISDTTFRFNAVNSNVFFALNGTQVFDTDIDFTIRKVQYKASTFYEKGDVIANNGNEYFKLSSASGITDHTQLTNIGTNTHAQLDSHLANGNVHYTQSEIDFSNVVPYTGANLDVDLGTNKLKLGQELFIRDLNTDGQGLIFNVSPNNNGLFKVELNANNETNPGLNFGRASGNYPLRYWVNNNTQLEITDGSLRAPNTTIAEINTPKSLTTLEAVQSYLADLTGWAAYTDTQYTSVSPFTLTGNTATYTNLPNNAGSTLDTYKPSDIVTFYDSTTQKITGREGDGVSWSIEIKATPAANNTWMEIGIDIGGGIPILYPDTYSFPRGAGQERSIIYDIPSAYTLNTWEANGGQVKVKSNNNITMHSIRYVLTRTHKAN